MNETTKQPSEQWAKCEKIMPFADGQFLFRLPMEWMKELEEKCGAGFGVILQRILYQQHSATEIYEIVRCGLIGGGMPATEAKTKCDRYIIGQPVEDALTLATAIICGAAYGYDKLSDELVPQPPALGEQSQ